MKKFIPVLLLFIFLLNSAISNAQQIREDFETTSNWAWSPWIVIGTATSTRSEERRVGKECRL